MSNMNVQNADRLLNSLTANNANASDGKNIVLRGNQQLGAVKAFFSGSTERQATIDRFQQALTAKYGEGLSSIATARLDHLKSSGKALNMGTIRSLINELNETKAQLPLANIANLESFMASPSSLSGVSFDEKMTALIDEHRIPEEYQDHFREGMEASLSESARLTGHLLTPNEIRHEMDGFAERWDNIFDCVVNGKYERHIHDLTGRVPAELCKDLLSITSAYTREVPSQLGLSLILEKIPVLRAAQPTGPISAEDIWNAVTNSAPRPENSNRNPMDISKLIEDHSFDSSQNRRMQPFINICIMTGVKSEVANRLIVNPDTVRLTDLFSTAQLTSLSAKDSIESATAQLTIDLHRMGHEDGGVHSIFTFTDQEGEMLEIDVNALPPEHTIDSSQYTDEQLADFPPTIKNAIRNGELIGLSNSELAQLPDGHGDLFKASRQARVDANQTIANTVRDTVRGLCGGNERQAAAAIYGLAQSGMTPIYSFSRLTGVPKTEHCAMNIDVKLLDNGDLQMTYTRPDVPREEGVQNLEGGYTYLVHPDGTSKLTALELSAS